MRTPLTSIRGALVLVEQMLPKLIPEKALRVVQMAQKNTARLILLVNDILDFEKLHANKVNFKFTIVDLNEEIAKAIELNATYALDRQVRLKAVSRQPKRCR
ncbi:histidine kinase dimerization/phospho-acceptor domain-containing protein [Breoghania sp.]|uniref:histidine kinase dimerization/phospho-acceptor domain-containing protein n=1 Tax=Breoghania sp. TaxID=2065378 RepID=UPI0026065EF5|nr:histidine kinase dimerization/phospho-acceptor domain-containing protein [Breoghania sp.]MDJ0931397.1 histidine kinase dimerization/phospho-acceptor domain-containing protein [Breoghania sp.]